MSNPSKLVLIVTGGIAAYKSLELIRRLRAQGTEVRCVLTRGGAQFVTPLSLAALSENPVHQDLFSLTEESEMGHIRLARWPDLILVAPASADFIARAAHGMADDLAATILLATDRPIVMAPAMNHLMWANHAVRRNVDLLKERGVRLIGPNPGDLACGETGPGRMAEPDEIVEALRQYHGDTDSLKGVRALVTSGPTHEAVDPVRFIGNHSSGKQGHAIARALARRGADVTLVSGPVALPDPSGVTTHHVQSATEMLRACEASLPVDVAICAAAVADWRPVDVAEQKLKKQPDQVTTTLQLTANPDILATLARGGNRRPRLVIGFAAETEQVLPHAQEKRRRKGCDWIIANDVSASRGIFGGDRNEVHFIDGDHRHEAWPNMSKDDIADRLAEKIAQTLDQKANA